MHNVSHEAIAANVRAYRKRQAAAGNTALILLMPNEAVTLLDEIKEPQGLRNRSQAFLQLIERGREATRQIAETCKSPPWRVGFCEFRDGPFGYRSEQPHLRT
jgi:hypothetical protein